NHWQLAVDVHQTNHPTTDHDCADIAAVDPRRYPATDWLWASPECTNHSVANGRRRHTGQTELFDNPDDPGATRSRVTMWDVPRFTETMTDRGHPYQAVIVENVVDVRWWVGWRGWIAVMHDLGYTHQVVYLNSAFAHGTGYPGAPQYRDRLYVVFTRRGLPAPDLDIRPPGWCPTCQTPVGAVQTWKRPEVRWGRYRAQYLYRCPNPGCATAVQPYTLPAAAIIDWTRPGQRIADRTAPSPRPPATASPPAWPATTSPRPPRPAANRSSCAYAAAGTAGGHTASPPRWAP
ncbi:DNA cytosine methyltransferase, partial [Frankia sp. Cr1]|uniref:DNA cytosine methyltransferase n=1 Tax=Frankia sp. Cr1 TaxID=3073931 RepID=UPI002AD56C71